MRYSGRKYGYFLSSCFRLKPLILTGFLIIVFLLSACAGPPPAEPLPPPLPEAPPPPLREPPQAALEASVTSGQAPLSITFSNTSKNSDEFQWDFGDGATATSSTIEEPVSHEYTKAGKHTVTLKAIRKGEPPKTSTATLTITVKPGALDTVTLPPVEVAAGETKQLEVMAKDQYGNRVSEMDAAWSLTDENAGSVTKAGALTAGEVAGAFGEVEVKVTQGETERKAAASVTITPGPLEQVVIAPNPSEIGMEMTQQFVAVGADQYGNRISGLSFTWSVENGSGTIDANGLFTAGDTAGTYKDTVKAEATGDSVTQSGTASVTVEPDRITFISDLNDDQRDIYVMDADGTNVERLTTTKASEYMCSWSPDGRRLVYDSYEASDGILVMNDDGSHKRLLIARTREVSPIYPAAREVAPIYPAWSPDGSKIAFVKADVVEGELEKRDIFVMDVDGSNVTRLTHTPGEEEWMPAWSPDGTKLAYSCGRKLEASVERGQADRYGFRAIYVMNVDGTGRKRLRISPPDAIGAVWSPDGTKIAFASGRARVAIKIGREDLEHCVDYKIAVMNADGSDIRQLSPNIGGGICPVWSPDGRKIVFISGEIYIMDANGENETRLTQESSKYWSPESIYWSPGWAPRKKGVEVTEASVIIPEASTLKAMTVQEVTTRATERVVLIKTDKGTGSGFIIDPSGLILTCNHVISEAEEITVYLKDGTSHTGTVEARDLVRDLAVVKIAATDLPHLEMGDLSQAGLGQQLVVLGYPLQSETVSVTSGLLSKIEFDSGRNITLVQTDSAINPGNSGGPMLNLQGQVIGVVSAKMVGIGIEGVGFAISANTVNTYLPRLKAG